MLPLDITVVPKEDSKNSEVLVHLPDGTVSHQWMRSETPIVPACEDLTPWLFALLPFAMKLNARLVLRGSVDEVGLASTQKVQDVLSKWYPKSLQPVEVVAEKTHRSNIGEGSASFFSGGVDSFYTLASAHPSLDNIVFVGGFDIPWSEDERLESAWSGTRDAAAEFGARAIRVDVNIRDLTDGHTHWGYEQHGASIASVASALRHVVAEVRIASSYVDEQLHPWGTHPDLDPLWSTSGQLIQHDQTTKTRAEKVAALAESNSFRRNLRVCWQSDLLGNCGTCEKCVRTRVNLSATGNDGICTSLAPLHLADLSRLTLSDPAERMFAEENLAYIQTAGIDDEPLRLALVSAIRRGARRESMAKLARLTVFKIPGVRTGFDKFRIQ